MPELMASEENSLSLGILGVWWALSMLSMIAGIYNIGRKNNRKKTL
jgi:ABC-type Co2+ transport system permease subunit